MSNWLGFSLQAPQVDQTQASSSVAAFDSDEIPGGECFPLTSSDHVSCTLPCLNLPPADPPLGIFQAFGTNNTASCTNQSQDWNMKDASASENNYQSRSSTSDLSMIMGSASCRLEREQDGRPKLENLLGNSCNSGDYMYPNSSVELPSDGRQASNKGNNSSTVNATGIGLSMIKNWLRNQTHPNLGDNNISSKINDNINSNNSTTTCHGVGLEESSNNVVVTTTSLNSAHTLSLSMSSALQAAAATTTQSEPKGTTSNISADPQSGAIIEVAPRKSIDTFGQRTSIYRGVTRHRWTGRYEAHLWDNSCRREGQTRKGRQGGYDKEEKAARAYDLAALKYWGTTTTTNFPISNYEKELEEMKHMTRQEYVASLRRKSSGFSRGASIYRGVTRHHQHGRWQARIGRVAGNKDLYLGTFSTQEEAAEAYDIAAIKFRGLNAVTNFDMSRYDVKSILESSSLPIGGAAKRLNYKESLDDHDFDHMPLPSLNHNFPSSSSSSSTSTTATNSYTCWPTNTINSYSCSFQQHFNPHSTHPSRLLWCKQEQENDPQQDFNQLHHQLGIVNNNNYYNYCCTHNFFQPQQQQPPPNLVHNLMDSVEHGGGGSSSSSLGYGAGGFDLPIATVIDHDVEMKSLSYHQDVLLASSTDYFHPHHHAKNLINTSYNGPSNQQPSGGVASNSWVVPSGVGTLAAAQTFTVWNDT
ncbi:hypothetical protein NMG60_11011755 [Bertholletia excelsa]